MAGAARLASGLSNKHHPRVCPCTSATVTAELRRTCSSPFVTSNSASGGPPVRSPLAGLSVFAGPPISAGSRSTPGRHPTECVDIFEPIDSRSYRAHARGQLLRGAQCWCVVEDGWITRLRASPTFARCESSLAVSTNSCRRRSPLEAEAEYRARALRHICSSPDRVLISRADRDNSPSHVFVALEELATPASRDMPVHWHTELSTPCRNRKA